MIDVGAAGSGGSLTVERTSVRSSSLHLHYGHKPLIPHTAKQRMSQDAARAVQSSSNSKSRNAGNLAPFMSPEWIAIANPTLTIGSSNTCIDSIPLFCSYRYHRLLTLLQIYVGLRLGRYTFVRSLDSKPITL